MTIFVLGDDVPKRIVGEAQYESLLEAEQFAAILDLEIENASEFAGDSHERKPVVKRDGIDLSFVSRRITHRRWKH